MPFLVFRRDHLRRCTEVIATVGSIVVIPPLIVSTTALIINWPVYI